MGGGDTFSNDLHPDLRADFVIANPPFNISNWGGENLRDDPRWAHGKPPAGNANFAWIQHMLHHLAPTGTMATILANGSLSSQQSGEGDIRRNLIEADLVECIVALPEKLFFTTGIPVCLWFLTKDKSSTSVKSKRVQRDRKGEILFIDARQMGEMVTRTVREPSDEDIARIAGTYHAWRGESASDFADEPGFCRSVGTSVIRDGGYALMPSFYIGSATVAEETEPLDSKLARLREEIRGGFRDRAGLVRDIENALSSLRPENDD